MTLSGLPSPSRGGATPRLQPAASPNAVAGSTPRHCESSSRGYAHTAVGMRWSSPQKNRRLFPGEEAPPSASDGPLCESPLRGKRRRVVNDERRGDTAPSSAASPGKLGDRGPPRPVEENADPQRSPNRPKQKKRRQKRKKRELQPSQISTLAPPPANDNAPAGSAPAPPPASSGTGGSTTDSAAANASRATSATAATATAGRSSTAIVRRPNPPAPGGTASKRENKRKTASGGGYMLTSDIEKVLRVATFTKPTAEIDSDAVKAFGTELREELKYNFGKRKQGKAEREWEEGFYLGMVERGFDAEQLACPAVRGSTSFQQRYLLEDLIQCHPLEGGDTHRVPFVVAFRQWKDNGGAFSKARRVQRKLPGHGGLVRSFRKEEYLVLTARMCPNDDHRAVKHADMKLDDIVAKFNDETGRFQIELDGTKAILTVTWKSIIETPMEVLFFGPPVLKPRFYARLFDDKTSLSYCFQVYKQLALECWGDSLACSKLNEAFQTKRIEILEHENEKLQKALDNPGKGLTFVGKESSTFFANVNELFRKNMFDCHRVMQNYLNPIVTKTELAPYLNESKDLFPLAWNVLSNLRGMRPTHARGAHLIEAKEWQVFFEICQLARMSDRDKLVDWALVQTMANQARAVSQKSGCNTNYWGTTVSAATCLRKQKLRTTHLVSHHIETLKVFKCIVMVMDNCQKGQKKANQNGHSSSNFVNGTSQLAIKAWEYNDTTYDHLRVLMTFDEFQAIPLPPGMPNLDQAIDFDNFHLTLLRYKDLAPNPRPDVSGKTVVAYAKARRIVHWLNHSKRVFATEDVSIEGNDFDSAKLAKIFACFKSSGAKELLRCAAAFEPHIVGMWKPNFGRVTERNFLGIAGLDESAKAPAFALTMDFLLKVGILVDTTGKGDWELAPDYKERRAIFVGDAATAEAIVAWIKEKDNRELSFSETALTLEMFLDAMSVVMIIPGDWHAGLAMLQSIVTLYWEGIIEPFAKLLGLQRVLPDTRKCYFTTFTLVTYISDEMVRMFKYEFYANHWNEYDDQKDNSAQFLCDAESQFESFLWEITEGEDGWRRACALFVLMVFDFTSFVKAYRGEDAVGIELGYKAFHSIWHELDQKKYLERYLHQIETLYQDFPLSRLHEQRINRTCRRYDVNDGKQASGIDEEIEYMHGELYHLPMPESLEGFCAQGADLGLMMRCKRFVDMFYNIGGVKEETEVNRRGVKPSMIPEMQFIWECLTLANTEKECPSRRFSVDLISSLEGKTKTNLTREKKKKQLKETGVSETYNMLFSTVCEIDGSCLSGIASGTASATESPAVGDGNGEDAAGQSDNGNEEAAHPDDVVAAHVYAEDDDWVCPAEAKEKGKKKKVHDKALKNNWREGNKALKKKDIKKQRQNSRNRVSRKRKAMKELYKEYQASKQQANNTRVGKETPELQLQPWRLRAAARRKKASFKTKILSFE